MIDMNFYQKQETFIVGLRHRKWSIHLRLFKDKTESRFQTSAGLTAVFLPVLLRMSHARGKAEAAEGVAQKATEECRLARIAAKELSPSFHIYGNGEWTTLI